MLGNVTIEPMTEDFILWRCLHGGPLTEEGIDELPSDRRNVWEARQAANPSVLKEITKAYGTCAMLARDGDLIVGSLRFYPKALCFANDDFAALCLQSSVTGPKDHVAAKGLPSLDEIEDKTLMVHCLMLGSPFQDKNPYQRKGIGSRMVRELIRWAKENGWDAIEANAVEDLSILYEHAGQAGKRFWEKLGFQVVATKKKERGFPELETARKQAAEQGLDPDIATTWTMRMDLG